jgi:hypothetical protein
VPFEGAGDKLVAFLHPKSTFGVLTEFCQPADTMNPPICHHPPLAMAIDPSLLESLKLRREEALVGGGIDRIEKRHEKAC